MKKNGACVILTLILPLKRCGAFGGKQQQKVSFTKRNEEIVMKRFGIAALCAVLVVFGLAGCSDGSDGGSTGNVLQINIPEGTTVAVASLVTAENMASQTPSVVGFNSSGKFELLEFTNMTPWKGTGSFYIFLAEKANPSDPGNTYGYKGEGQEPEAYIFSEKTTAIDWGKFMQTP